jgi:hypothetical protein
MIITIALYQEGSSLGLDPYRLRPTGSCTRKPNDA